MPLTDLTWPGFWLTSTLTYRARVLDPALDDGGWAVPGSAEAEAARAGQSAHHNGPIADQPHAARSDLGAAGGRDKGMGLSSFGNSNLLLGTLILILRGLPISGGLSPLTFSGDFSGFFFFMVTFIYLETVRLSGDLLLWFLFLQTFFFSVWRFSSLWGLSSFSGLLFIMLYCMTIVILLFFWGPPFWGLPFIYSNWIT